METPKEFKEYLRKRYYVKISKLPARIVDNMTVDELKPIAQFVKAYDRMVSSTTDPEMIKKVLNYLLVNP